MTDFSNQDLVPCFAFACLNLRSSSDFDADHGVKQGILNFKYDRKGMGKGGEGWKPSISDKNQFIIASSMIPMKFVKLDLQGSGNSESYVTSYIIRYSLNNKKWYEYKNGEIFKGNTDNESIVSQRLDPPIIARSISIHPVQWKNDIGLRWELYTKEFEELSPQIQMGTISIGDKTLGNEKSPLEYTRKVQFDKEFIGVPKISLGIKSLDYSNLNGQHRCSVEAKNVTPKGFDCIFKRYDNLINELSVDFTAAWTDDLIDFNLIHDKEFKNANSLFFYKKSSQPSQ
ncbi:hypothetical protein ACTFIW_003998 [Dictyostelium discoideum]